MSVLRFLFKNPKVISIQPEGHFYVTRKSDVSNPKVKSSTHKVTAIFSLFTLRVPQKYGVALLPRCLSVFPRGSPCFLLEQFPKILIVRNADRLSDTGDRHIRALQQKACLINSYQHPNQPRLRTGIGYCSGH